MGRIADQYDPIRPMEPVCIEHICRALHVRYGSPNLDNKPGPLDELIFIILSQITTHPSLVRTYERLRKVYPTWEKVAAAPLHHLQRVIEGAGLSNRKAPQIQAVIRWTIKDFGVAILDPLRNWPDEDAERYLTSLPGVGTKTAKCVLMCSLRRPVLPVDTHVKRVAERLGLLPRGISMGQAHQMIESVVLS